MINTATIKNPGIQKRQPFFLPAFNLHHSTTTHFHSNVCFFKCQDIFRTPSTSLTFQSDITRRSMDAFRRVRFASVDEVSAARFCPFEPKNRTKQRHPVCTGRQNCRRAGKVPCILPGGMYTETVPGLYYKPGLHSCIASGAAPLYVLREERYSPWLNVFTVKKTTKSARL